jgi:tetratricopeptide (TPR) repeat protein
MGTALFYMNLKKYHTAIKIIENYLRVSKPSVKIYAVYLDVLVRAGDLVKAKPVFDKLTSIKKKPVEAYLVMAKYLELDEKHSEATELLKLAGQLHPTSVAVLLDYSKQVLREENFKKYKKILGVIKALKAEQSPVFYSRYLESLGILSAVRNKNELAVKYFKKALTISESNELRSKLAALEIGGSENVEKLIVESKIVELLRKSKIYIKESKWNRAFSTAIEAADMDENYIPAQLLLADIQIKRGYFASAIKTLLELKKDWPIHNRINFILINAYISSFKLSEAKRQISILSQSKFVNSAEYASLLGRYFVKKGNVKTANNWFKESLKRNPINDEDYYIMAKMYLKYRRYKKSKGMLSKAISLDPLNVDYRALYAKILYELDSAETAIGYLRNELEKNKDNPKLLGDIAVYYYKNGQMTEFKRYKEKVEKLTTRDPSFYQFLITAAKLDDRVEDVIINAKELIKVNPGDLETRMLLGEYLLQQKEYNEALIIFKSIEERLVAYPKANYFIAKTYLAMNKLDLALEAGEKEKKLNPTLSEGHYITGEIHRLKKNLVHSRKNLEIAISKNAKNEEALMSLGWIKYKQNNLEQARELYLRAYKVNKNNAQTHKMLGYIYRGIGQSSQAIDSFQTYLNLSPAAPDRAQIKRLMRVLK